MWHQHLCNWDDSCITVIYRSDLKDNTTIFSVIVVFLKPVSVHVPVQVAEEQLHGVVVWFGQILDQFLHSLNFVTGFFDPCSEKRQQQVINMCQYVQPIISHHLSEPETESRGAERNVSLRLWKLIGVKCKDKITQKIIKK